MVRWVLVLALVAGAAVAQEAPTTAAEAAARARGEKPDATGGANTGANARDPSLPSADKVQAAQDRCPPNQPDCAQKQREPASQPASQPLLGAPAPSLDWGHPPPSSAGLFGSELVSLGSPALNAPGGLAGAAAVPSHPIELSAYFILGGQWVQQDPNYLYVGRNNGFSLADARIEITGRPTETLWLYLSMDGAVANRSPMESGRPDITCASRPVSSRRRTTSRTCSRRRRSSSPAARWSPTASTPRRDMK